MRLLHQLALICGFTAVLPTIAHADDWKLEKEEAGISIYLSPVDGSKYKAYRGVTTVKADIATIRALQEDVSGSCAWIFECKEQKLLKQEGDQAWTHTYFTPPWPVTARDSILHITTTQGSDGSLTRTLEGVADYLPEEEGYVRVAKVEGLWKLTPKGPGQTEITYQVQTEPGGSVPSWLANSFVVDAPFNTLKGLRERAEKK